MKRLVVLGLVVVLVTVMSAPAALWATGGGGGGNGDCKKNDRSGKCEYKKVKICHKPGKPAEKILKIPQSAVRGHLGHGDTFKLHKCKKKDNGGHHNGGHHNGGHHNGHHGKK